MGSDLNNQLDVQGWICRHSGLVSRPLRIAVENGWYHVLNRGIDGRQLFSDDRANEHFLELLKSMPERFNLRIHAFVLMGNMLKAQRLIRETSRSLIEIALEVGYTSPSHFAQVFRRTVGMAPTEFRMLLE